MWVSSHWEIPGNEKADQTASESIQDSNSTFINFSVTGDIIYFASKGSNLMWQTFWEEKTQITCSKILKNKPSQWGELY